MDFELSERDGVRAYLEDGVATIYMDIRILVIHDVNYMYYSDNPTVNNDELVLDLDTYEFWRGHEFNEAKYNTTYMDDGRYIVIDLRR